MNPWQLEGHLLDTHDTDTHQWTTAEMRTAHRRMHEKACGHHHMDARDDPEHVADEEDADDGID